MNESEYTILLSTEKYNHIQAQLNKLHSKNTYTDLQIIRVQPDTEDNEYSHVTFTAPHVFDNLIDFLTDVLVQQDILIKQFLSAASINRPINPNQL
jgi:hypothetical protein